MDINKIEEKLHEYFLIPVITIDDKEKARNLGKTLIKSELPVAEITLRTKDALDAIKIISTNYPQILIGAGTVLTVQQAIDAINAGAKFIVSPCLDLEVIDYCMNNNVPVFPGVATPTEINTAQKKGLKIVKFFPSETYGGIKAINSISAPFSDVKFIPTGGISLSNLHEYLGNNKVWACGGTWLAKKEYLNNDEFDMIENNIFEALKILKEIRR